MEALLNQKLEDFFARKFLVLAIIINVPAEVISRDALKIKSVKTAEF